MHGGEVITQLSSCLKIMQNEGFLSNKDLKSLLRLSSVVHSFMVPLLQSFVYRIPRGEKITTFSPFRIEVASPDDISPSYTDLIYLDTFYSDMDPMDEEQLKVREATDNLPQTLRTLVLYSDVPVDHLPNSLSTLSIGLFFSQFVDHLPSSLTKLTFGGQFNQPVDHLPLSITQLAFNSNFNQPIDHLPPSLTHLSVNRCFNQPLDNLPTSLKILHIKSQFNQPLDHLPLSLTYLSISGAFKSCRQPTKFSSLSPSTFFFQLPHRPPSFFSHLSLPWLPLQYSLLLPSPKSGRSVFMGN